MKILPQSLWGEAGQTYPIFLLNAGELFRKKKRRWRGFAHTYGSEYQLSEEGRLGIVEEKKRRLFGLHA